MARLTKPLGKNKGYFVDEASVNHVDNGYTGEAIDKLAKFENALDALTSSQIEVTAELEKLRNEDKTKSVRFKELMVKKLTNATMLSFFKNHGIEE